MKTYVFALLLALAFRADAASEKVRIYDLRSHPQVTKTLEGRDAADILQAFDRLPWDSAAGKRCHVPAFRFERTFEGTVVLDATICFHCCNVAFLQPTGKGTQGFDATADSAKKFRTLLEGLFSAP